MKNDTEYQPSETAESLFMLSGWSLFKKKIKKHNAVVFVF